MLGGLIQPRYITSYSGGSGSREASASASYDYSGLEDHLKSQDMVDDLRAQKYASLYGGDVAGSVATGDKIRSLLGKINANAPGATEKNPHTVVNPLAKVQSSSGSDGVRQQDPDFAGHHDHQAGLGADQDGQPDQPEWRQNLINKNNALKDKRLGRMVEMGHIA
jgi:hypothetical protein